MNYTLFWISVKQMFLLEIDYKAVVICCGEASSLPATSRLHRGVEVPVVICYRDTSSLPATSRLHRGVKVDQMSVCLDERARGAPVCLKQTAKRFVRAFIAIF